MTLAAVCALSAVGIFASGVAAGIAIVFHVEHRSGPRLSLVSPTSGPPPVNDLPPEKVRVNAEVPQHAVWAPTEAMRRAHRAIQGSENT